MHGCKYQTQIIVKTPVEWVATNFLARQLVTCFHIFYAIPTSFLTRHVLAAVRAWFLEIVLVSRNCFGLCVGMCVCVFTLEGINNQWYDVNHVWLFKQVLQLYLFLAAYMMIKWSGLSNGFSINLAMQWRRKPLRTGGHSDYQDPFVWRKITFLWKDSKLWGFSPLAPPFCHLCTNVNLINKSTVHLSKN